jgi:hypothetical protein
MTFGHLELYCMYCHGTIGHSEYVFTGDEDSENGHEYWFCCHACRDAGLPCETFHKNTKELNIM